MIDQKLFSVAMEAQQTACMVLDKNYNIQWFNRAFQAKVADKVEPLCLISSSHWLGENFFSCCLAESVKAVLMGLADNSSFQLNYSTTTYAVEATQIEDTEGRSILLEWKDISSDKLYEQSLDEIIYSIEQGILNQRLPVNDKENLKVCSKKVNLILDSIIQHIKPFQQSIDAMAECKLLNYLPTNLSGEIGQLYLRYNVSLSNLTEALSQTASSSKQISLTTSNIVEQNKKLSKRTDEQAQSLKSTVSNIKQLSETVAATTENTKLAVQQSQSANEVTHEGIDAVDRLVKMMGEIHENSIQASEIVEIINSISFQINVLSLNATIEAARAGIHGKSFNVVAKEVRNLSKNTENAVHQIRTLMKESEKMAEEGVLIADNTSSIMGEVLDSVTQANQSMNGISEATKEQNSGISSLKRTIETIDEITQKNHNLVVDLGTNTQELASQSGYLIDAAHIFELNDDGMSHPLHQRALKIAQEGALKIGQILEQAISLGELSLDDIINTLYTEITGTNPVQYSTSYDAYADRTFPAIQEPLLEDNDFITYAIATDLNAYVATHNNFFAQPATGDYEQDLKFSRTKRIFSDRVGEISSQHLDEWKLQTYRRDTGELMFDMSAPVYINSHRFGGFRVGYRIE